MRLLTTGRGSLYPSPAAALIGCLAFYLVNNGLWLALDASSPSYDKAAHAGFALQYLRLFEAPTRLSLTKLLIVTQYWPPFFHLCSVLVTLPFGFSIGTVAATNFLFLPVAVWSIFSIGRRLFDERVGVGAVVLTLLYPIVYALARTVLVDFALLAMVALSLDLVLSTDAGLDRRRSWQLGLAAGCAMLTKWTAVLFVAGPAIWWLVRAVRRERPRTSTLLIGLGSAAVVAAAVAAPWYVKSFDAFLQHARVAFGSDPAQEGDPISLLPSIWWYCAAVRDQVIRWPLLVPTLVGVGAALKWSRAREGLAFLAWWILPAFTFFVLIPNKDGRFLMPLLPAVAMMAAAGFQSMPWPRARPALWGLVVAVGVLQFYAISFAWPVRTTAFYGGSPQRADWKVSEIAEAMAALPVAGVVHVAVLANEPDFEPNLFTLAAAMRRLPLQVDGVGHEAEPIAAWARYDLIVSKTGRISPRYSAAFRPALRGALNRWVLERQRPQIVLWRRWPLPDGSHAEVFRVRHESVPASGTAP